MIKYILANKTRIGLLALPLGLLCAVIALYIDQIRGEASTSVGLYQIVGAIFGYILSSIGGVLVMKETDIRKTIQVLLFYGGGIITLLSLAADYVGVAGAAGFDKFQFIGATFGLLILTGGYFIFPEKFNR